MNKRITIFILSILFIVTVQAQFISEVLEYKPAPGQFINSSPWGMPDSDNAAVSIVGQLTGAMSLGAFGGYVVFKFDNSVENHSDNPYGIDFVIYGNPLREMGNPDLLDRVTWAEPGIVSVMKDENMNGLPDDTWYELAGSDYFFSTTTKNYQVTYSNPGSEVATNVPWSDNQGGNGNILKNVFHKQPYYPLAVNFSEIAQDQYTLSGTQIESNIDSTKMSSIKSWGRAWGYADNTLRGEYDALPDNPYTQDINLAEEGSGGDSFDIDWAVDEDGNYINLDKVDFIKVHNSVMAHAGWLGEVSTEITGAFDVAPNSTITGELDMIVIKKFPDTISIIPFSIEAFVYHKGRLQKNADIKWTCDNTDYSINEDGEIIKVSGVNIPNNSEIITANAFTVINNQKLTFTAYSLPYSNPTSIAKNTIFRSNIKVYPNPASKTIAIKGISNARISIFNITGYKLLELYNYSENQIININNLPNGLYIININTSNTVSNIRFLKF